MKHILALTSLCVLLAACGTAPAPSSAPAPFQPTASTGSLSQLISFIETTAPQKINADLDAAGVYAASQNDLLGAACYPSIKAWIASLPPLPAGKVTANIAARPAPAGAFTGFEYARVDRRVVETSASAWQAQIQALIAQGPPQALLLGCGGLVQDETNFFLRIAALIGAGAATANVAPILVPALPAIGTALPVALP